MRALIQRVSYANVSVDGIEVGRIDAGLLILLGISTHDTPEVVDKLAYKTANLRIFRDQNDKMNLSLIQTTRQALVVSQFTLYADAAKGLRPSYIQAAPPRVAEALYLSYIRSLETLLERPVPRGVFGAKMQVNLSNDGPVTIMLDTDELS